MCCFENVPVVRHERGLHRRRAVYGYKRLVYSPLQQALRSEFRRAYWRDGTMRAVAPVPKAGNGGIYAWATPPVYVAAWVAVEVALWGTLYEHRNALGTQHGFRASRAEIVRVLAPTGRVADRYVTLLGDLEFEVPIEVVRMR